MHRDDRGTVLRENVGRTAAFMGHSGTVVAKSMYWTAPDVTNARSYECGDVDPDWEFARQLRLNVKCGSAASLSFRLPRIGPD